MVERVAPTDATVFIAGESGCGKEVLARTIHERSKRSRGPFVAINCGAIPTNLIETELFGREKGAFTGANRQHRGCFERAATGTLFLDEVSEMAPTCRFAYSRVLETGRLVRIGLRTRNEKPKPICGDYHHRKGQPSKHLSLAFRAIRGPWRK